MSDFPEVPHLWPDSSRNPKHGKYVTKEMGDNDKFTEEKYSTPSISALSMINVTNIMEETMFDSAEYMASEGNLDQN